jgi:hypothetical protein
MQRRKDQGRKKDGRDKRYVFVSVLREIALELHRSGNERAADPLFGPTLRKTRVVQHRHLTEERKETQE